MRGWIGVDLDGTLAKSTGAQTYEIGVPIHPMGATRESMARSR
jgi:hypothetical protein